MSVTAARGFLAASGSIGVKPRGALDAAVVATSDGRPVPAAAVFTQNRAAAAPVLVSREHLERSGGYASAVVLTSGNANAATGEAGITSARALCSVAGGALGVEPEAVLVAQTGLIGVPFPPGVVEGLASVAAGGSSAREAARSAAQAIMTTDTVAKEAVAHAAGCVVGGMAKGAAMLAPHLATMLAVITTDAQVEPVLLRELLLEAVETTFNRLSVDGCTSTNDTVFLLASGQAGPPRGSGAARVADGLGEALGEVCASLSAQMAADAEGSTKSATITVKGARSDAEAHAAARKVASSALVRCSLNGSDPYWGRVASELGSAGVDFSLDALSVDYGGIVVCRGGVGVDHDAQALRAHMAGRHVEVTCDLGLGEGRGAMLTCDLSEEYIRENRRTS